MYLNAPQSDDVLLVIRGGRKGTNKTARIRSESYRERQLKLSRALSVKF